VRYALYQEAVIHSFEEFLRLTGLCGLPVAVFPIAGDIENLYIAQVWTADISGFTGAWR
jgi:hypothetical protein